MTVQTINIGNIANDGTGDNLRVAFDKINKNFADLDDRSITQSGLNLGTGQPVFYTKENNVLYFKTLVASDSITLSSTNDEITIGTNENFTIQADSDSVNISGTNKFFGIKGSTNIDTAITSNDISISVTGDGLLALDPSPTLSGDLNVNNHSITNASSVSANTFVGNLVGTVNGITVTDNSTNLDFGPMIPNITSLDDYILYLTSIDYGTFLSPSVIDSDFGSI